MTDVAGNPEEERHADFYHQTWAHEAVSRYFYQKIQQKRAELDSALGTRAELDSGFGVRSNWKTKWNEVNVWTTVRVP